MNRSLYFISTHSFACSPCQQVRKSIGTSSPAVIKFLQICECLFMYMCLCLFSVSNKVSAPLMARILQQDPSLKDTPAVHQQAKILAHQERRKKQLDDAQQLRLRQSSKLFRASDLAREHSASTWLTTAPIDTHRFAFHNAGFSGCYMFAIRLVASSPPCPVHVWQQLPRGPCSAMSNWWLSQHPPQLSMGYPCACYTAKRGLQFSNRWAVAATAVLRGFPGASAIMGP